MKVLVTDYAWKDLEIENGMLREVGASVLAAESGTEEELVELAPKADGILTNWKRVTQRVIAHAPKCKAIGRYGVGLDNIDLRFATEMGIPVTNVPAYCLEEVSDHALALLLALARKISFYDRNIKNGEYQLQAGPPLRRMKGKTLGIVGYGKIGRAVAHKARSFGLKVMVYDRKATNSLREEAGVEYASLSEFLARADYVSLHAPLNPETRHLFAYEAFQRMKPTAVIVNTARGDIIDREALLRALNEGLIAGAGLDVLAQEPPEANDPLTLHPKVIVTPHAAFNSLESVEDLRKTAASQMAKLLSGSIPEFVVNPEVLNQANLRVSLRKNQAVRSA